MTETARPMTDISFYHLTRQSLTQALPRLLEKVVAGGHRAVVLAAAEERIAALDAALWTYDPQSFLPHGTKKTGHGERQPIYLASAEENPNGANILVLVDGMEPAYLGSFARCLDMFDGASEESVAAARERWKRYKDAGHTLAYWQQSPEGRWEQKA